VVVGDGTQRARLEALAAATGLGPRITFTGALTPAVPALAGFDVVVVPSRSEGLPMLCWRPWPWPNPSWRLLWAASRRPWRMARQASWWSRRTRAVAEAVGVLLDDPARAADMGRAGRDRVAEIFSLDDQLRAYLEVFREVLEGRRAADKGR